VQPKNGFAILQLLRRNVNPRTLPGQHGGLSNGRSKPVPRGNRSGSAWESNPERSHNLRIHPRLGGRNFCTSEQARLSRGSAEPGTAAGTLPAAGKGMRSARRSQRRGRLRAGAAGSNGTRVKEGDPRERGWGLSPGLRGLRSIACTRPLRRSPCAEPVGVRRVKIWQRRDG